jgi:signal transduction histidine kinase
VTQPVKDAFAARDAQIRLLLIMHALLLLAAGVLAFAVQREVDRRRRSMKAMEEAMQMKSEFTSMVSHELRTPLTVIKESVAIVEDGTAGPVNEEQRDFLLTAKRNIDRLARLINNVLDYQKLEAGRMELHFEEAELQSLVRDASAGFALTARNKGLDLRMALDDGLPKARVDKDKISQVLANFLNNALKFTDKGSITVRAAAENGCVRVSVEDTGPGIRREDYERLFKSFSQLSSGTERKTGGTGLGLAISKKIIEAHGGRIGLESEPGKGTTFYFTLPSGRAGR